jgi:hypothetical protein
MLATSPADLPDGLADQVARACEPVADVKAAYVARQLQTDAPDRPAVEVLSVALELRQSPTEPGLPHTREVMLAVLRELPSIGRHRGVNVLAEAALPVWQHKAVRVFERRPTEPA